MPGGLRPGDDIEKLKAMDAWRNGKVYIKHGFLADSYDKGYTWVNERFAPNTPDLKHGLCPSDLVQLPDGRVVWTYTHRYGPDSGVMARVSKDDGKTWSAERYRVRLLRQPGHGTYPTSTVLKDGTILTVCSKNHGNRAIAIRWRIPTKVKKMPPIPRLKTGTMGGVPSPDRGALAQMQKGQYILHAKAGKITKVPVQKSRLPHDPKGHVQIVDTVLAPDGTIYVSQNTIICKSTDGGRTWTSHKRGPAPAGEDSGNPLVHPMTGPFQLLNDGTFIKVLKNSYNESQGKGPARVMASRDEGRSWKKISEFPIDVSPIDYPTVIGGIPLFRFPDDTLLYTAVAYNHTAKTGWPKDRRHKMIMYRSEDGGMSWDGPVEFHTWVYEGGITLLPSGRLLAVARYQRALLPGDPPDLIKKTGGKGYPYKHIFLLDSDDGGRSWHNFRQLTTVFGQARGFPAALSDGTVVVIHDTRYGPGVPSGRAMISYDEGQTWEDEAYYMYYGKANSGYSQNVVLEDGTILTIAGTAEVGWSWDTLIGRSDLTAIRWKPVKD